jgi:N-acetylmuramoyl-L-alanine amidase
MKKRIFSLLMAVCAVLSLAVTAAAVEVPEEGKGNCSIEVAVRYRGEPISDGELTAVRVGYVDEDDGTNEEVAECNAFAPDYAVDIHNNAGGGDGAEVFHHYGGGKGKQLAENILAEIVKLGQNSRGAKVRKNSNGKDYYAFIRETSCPAVIVEACFVDNASDLQILATEDRKKSMGVAIAKGILKTLGVEFQAEKGYWKVQVGAYLYRENAVAMQKKIKAVGFDAFIVKE